MNATIRVVVAWMSHKVHHKIAAIVDTEGGSLFHDFIW